MMNPLDGRVVWPVPDNHSISVTLFKDPRTHEMEDKDWTFVLEDVSFLFYIFLIFCFNGFIILGGLSDYSHLFLYENCFNFGLHVNVFHQLFL